MNKEIKTYETNLQSGAKVLIRTEKYGYSGFDIFVTIEGTSFKDTAAFIPAGRENVLNLGIRNNRPMMYQPKPEIMSAILADKNRPTEYRQQKDAEEAERAAMEKQFDDMYNDGAQGFNPYRKDGGDDKNEPMYKGDEF